jgi:tripartite-type tricarboxylate transporter receptor subunit TctC
MSIRLKGWMASAAGFVFAFSVVFIGMSMAMAEDYPKSGINMVIPYPPGGGSDMLTRIFDKYAKKEFGQNFVFLYKPGAGGAVGASSVAKSKPDGYTIGTVNTPHTVLQQLTGAGDFTVESFDYIAQVASTIQVLVTPGASKIKTLDQFIAAAKESPGRMTVGIPGAMGAEYMAVLKMMEKLGIKVTIVPSKGGADLLAALLGNHLDAGLHNDVIIAPEKEKMNLIAVAGAKKHPYFTDVPTFKELGYDVAGFTGRIYVGPKGMDPAKLARLRKGFEAIWNLPECQNDLNKANFGPDWKPGEELAKEQLDYKAEAEALLQKYGKK